MWPGVQGTKRTGLEEGQSRQAIVIPFDSGMLQVFAVFVFKGFSLMMASLIVDVIGYHVLVSQCIGESSIFLSPTRKLREYVTMLFDPLTC